MGIDDTIRHLQELKPYVKSTQDFLMDGLEAQFAGLEPSSKEYTLAVQGWVIAVGQMARVGFESLGVEMTLTEPKAQSPSPSRLMPPLHGMN